MKQKKLIIFVVITIIFVAIFIFLKINKEETNNQNFAILNREFKLEENEKISFNNKEQKFQIELEEINDSRCSEGQQCIWQGEISVRIKINNIYYILGSERKTSEKIKDTKYNINFIPEYNSENATFIIK